MRQTDNNTWSTETVHERLIDIRSRLDNKAPELEHVFVKDFINEAIAGLQHALPQAAAMAEAPAETKSLAPSQTQLPSSHSRTSPLAGALVSVKDLFDVRGFVTRAGSRFMENDPRAIDDAPPIGQLRQAGAVLVGHTNMTELAYSGLGLNPHYGTPENALRPGCIPGGSTAGGAISVAVGAADIAMGTDTGGSLRIPAAFNGIVGFKPSQSTVSRLGCKALSQSLDSVGPMAASVHACRLAFDCISSTACAGAASLKPVMIVPNNYGMDDMESDVADAFEQAINRLARSGFTIIEKPLAVLQELKALPVWHFAAVEARAQYHEAYSRSAELFDPRVYGRMTRAEEVDAVAYRRTLNTRAQLIAQFRQELNNAVLLMPTAPIMPPPLAVFDDDDTYSRINLQVLRNPSIANVMDGCSISLPYNHNGNTIGVMLTTAGHADHALLQTAAHCESVFAAE